MTDEMNNDKFVDNEDEDSIITLIDDEGNEVEFALMDAITMDDKEYVVLLPLEDDGTEDAEGEDDESEDDEVVIFQVVTDEEGNESFVGVDDEEEAQKVFDLFQAGEDDYDFGDAE